MSHHHDDKKHAKKLKKLHQLLKNRHLRDINLEGEAQQRNRDLDKEREEEIRTASLASSRAAAKAKAGAKPDTFRKLDVIRQTNSHRTRVAQDRWNRFAGTESGGGRGL